MPYKIIGRTIFTKSSGAWKKKQVCKSPAAATRAIKLLRGLEYGTLTAQDLKNYKNRHH